MKALQKSYATREQCKQLLELGFPADSADLCYMNESALPIVWDEEYQRKAGDKKIKMDGNFEEGFSPCWSVGRLMEIETICASEPPVFHYIADLSSAENTMIDSIINGAKYQKLNFNKL